MLGDFNAHHNLGHSAGTQDARGNALAKLFEDPSLMGLNEPTPTRVVAGSSLSSDITLMDETLAPAATWTVHPGIGSDHLSIVITLEGEVQTCPRTARTFTNFKHTNWNGLTQESERAFSHMPPTNGPLWGREKAPTSAAKSGQT